VGDYLALFCYFFSMSVCLFLLCTFVCAHVCVRACLVLLSWRAVRVSIGIRHQNSPNSLINMSYKARLNSRFGGRGCVGCGLRRKSSDASQPVNLGHAASGGALAPEPPRVTCYQPESIRIRAKKVFFHHKSRLSLPRKRPKHELLDRTEHNALK